MTLSKTVYKQRTEEELVDALQRLLDGLWARRHQSHTWTIPVDELRDVDCILMDGINELGKLREEVERLQAELVELAAEGDFHQAPEEIRARVHGLRCESKPTSPNATIG